MINPEHEEIIEQYRSLVGPHLATLAWFQKSLASDGREIGNISYFSVSGFVISVDDNWCFVTSGHVLEELDRLLSSASIGIRSVVFSATMGDGLLTENYVPFDYRRSTRGYWAPKDASLDAGVILLVDDVRAHLQSKGIRPFVGEKIVHSELHNFTDFFSIGIPCQTFGIKDHEGETFGYSQLQIQPLLPLDASEATDPRFSKDHFFVKPKVPLAKRELDGMSGSPIVGMRKAERGWEYGVCAIQTNYSEEFGHVVGCPGKVFFPYVQAFLQ